MPDPSPTPLAKAAIPALVTREAVNGVAFLTIDNPPVNALSSDLRRALIDHLTQVSRDERVLAVVLMGKHGTFIAGADLREFGHPLMEPSLPTVIEAIENCPKPIVAAIEGAALGGGYEIALACDGRIAVEEAVVGLPEGTFGIIPGAGGTVRLPRLTDAATALEIISSCRQVTAPEAEALGLVNAIVTDVREGAIALARSLGSRKNRLRDQEPKPFDAEALKRAAQTALRRGGGRPFAAEQVEAIRRAVGAPFDIAFDAARAAFQRLRDSDESAALRHLFFAERQAARIDGLTAVDPLPVRSVGIVGSGTMGSGIAAAFLAAGYPVMLADLKPDALAVARERVSGFLAKASDPAPLTLADNLERLADCDLLLEAVFEDLDVKTDLMARLDRSAKPDAILASNTSYLDLDRIAAAASRPGSVIGLHFFAPAHRMRLLEVIRGARTTAPVLKTALSLARRLGKVAVVSGVGEGFIGNRIYNAYRAQCEAMLVDGALPQDVDDAIEALGFAMGPFAVSDLSGLDIAWANRKRKQQASGDASRDVPILEWLVDANRLGRKTGAGWYRYDGRNRAPDPEVAKLVGQAREARGVRARSLGCDEIQDRALASIVNEALLVLEDGIAARSSDIDLVLVHGYGFPKHLGGPLFWARRQSREQLERSLAAVAAEGRLGDLTLLD